MKLQEISKLVDVAMPEGDQSIMTDHEQKAFAVLKALITKRLIEKSLQKIPIEESA